MPDEMQKVVIVNAAVPVEAAEILPVRVVETVPPSIAGIVRVVSNPRDYEYDVVTVTATTVEESAGAAEGVRKKLNDGWELHQAFTVSVGSVAILVYRRPK